jgi:hypothetical protein
VARVDRILADVSPRFARQVEISKIRIEAPVVTITGDR